MKERPGFMLYFELVPALDRLDEREAGQLFKALMAYARCGEILDLSGAAAVAFDMMRGRMDRDAEAYREKCRKSAYSAYVRESRRMGEEPPEYAEWVAGGAEPYRAAKGSEVSRNASDDVGRYATTTTNPITNTNPNTNPNPNTNTISNTIPNPDRRKNSPAPPAQDSDTGWVLAYLEERKRNERGGAECRKKQTV